MLSTRPAARRFRTQLASKASRALLLAALLLALAPMTCLASSSPRARPARRLSVTDTAHLQYITSEGSTVFEHGKATGALPGRMNARLVVTASFAASFTLYANGGTLTGHGTAAPHGSGRYQSFSGSLLITAGTGRYAHAHGRAGLYGVFDRHTYNVTVQTTGTLSY